MPSWSGDVIADFILRHAQPLITCAGPAPRVGPAMAQSSAIGDGALAAREGRLLFVGPTEVCDRLVEPAPDAVILDVTGHTVVPGFVDPHTHVVFAGDRRDELGRRLAGATYAEIAAQGGGILKTVHATRSAPLGELGGRAEDVARHPATGRQSADRALGDLHGRARAAS
jgi:imidazolonepropionase